MHELMCPHCGRAIHDDDALSCLFCGESLNRTIGFMASLCQFPCKAVSIVFVVLMVILFLSIVIF